DSLGSLGLPTDIKTADDLKVIMDAVKDKVLAQLRLWEFYVLDVNSDADAAVDSWVKGETQLPQGSAELNKSFASLTGAPLEELVTFFKSHA
ncbi:hypothetical protein MRO53_24975, partial [Escherichia coli]|nr:hypothetical protein [Escherichia coli]